MRGAGREHIGFLRVGGITRSRSVLPGNALTNPDAEAEECLGRLAYLDGDLYRGVGLPVRVDSAVRNPGARKSAYIGGPFGPGPPSFLPTTANVCL